jgi:hypothetical protein
MSLVKDGGICWASGCYEKATHTLYYTVEARINGMEPIEQDIEYCLEHVLYFFAWLQYCYPGQYSNFYITPPASELFGR